MLDSLTIDHGGKPAPKRTVSAEAQAAAIAEYKLASLEAEVARSEAILDRYADFCFCSDCFMTHDNTHCPHRPALTLPIGWGR